MSSNPISFKWDEYGKLVLGTVESVQHQVDKNTDHIEGLRKDCEDKLKAQNVKLKEQEDKLSSNMKYIITTIIVIGIFIIGVVIVDIRENRKKIEILTTQLNNLKRDFGQVLLITREHHLDALPLGYDTFIQRYSDIIMRGEDPNKSKKIKTNGTSD